MKISAGRSGQALVGIVFVALAFRLFRLTAQYAVNIFFWDQWDFHEASLFGHHSVWQIFRFQHGPHRQGLGGLLMALVEPWFRWNGRTEAFLVTSIVVVAGTVHVAPQVPAVRVDRLDRCRHSDAGIHPGAVGVRLEHDQPGSRNLPVTLIVLYCLAWTWRNQQVKYAAIVVLNFATLYTGFGIFLGLLTPLLLFAEYRQELRHRSHLLFCIAASVVSLASFFVSYENNDASGCQSIFSATPLQYGQFLSLMSPAHWESGASASCPRWAE
ncbi:MAG: hypothetical protein WDO73_20450 [Ignavibacteriota bacterium]